MGRWSQYDEDSYRLPDGMTRVGYDADTEVYTYRDQDGRTWVGAPGNRYGVLRPVGNATKSSTLSYSSLPYTIEYDDPRTPSSAYDRWESPASGQICLQFIFTPFQYLYRTVSQCLPSSTALTSKHNNGRRSSSESDQPLLSRTWFGIDIQPRFSSLTERKQSPRDYLLNGAHPRKSFHYINEKEKHS